jgi:hypothetical protein
MNKILRGRVELKSTGDGALARTILESFHQQEANLRPVQNPTSSDLVNRGNPV